MRNIERISISDIDHERLERLVRDRNTPQKVVWRARIVLLAGDGLTNHVTQDDLREGAEKAADPQAWADSLVSLALSRGSRDNVTCVVVAFERE